MIAHLVQLILQALLLSAGMVWNVAWSLVLGFAISGLVQSLVSRSRMQGALGRNGVRETALAVLFGAASSSCSYASAAVSRDAVQARRRPWSRRWPSCCPPPTS